MADLKIAIKNPSLDEGCRGIIFPAGDDLVVKILKREERGDQLVDEYNIQKELYLGKVRVPEPKGIVDVFLEDYVFNKSLFLKRDQKGILMQRLYGDTLKEIYHNRDEKFGAYIADCREQVDLARSLGFRPGDLGIHNAILNQKDGKAYLTDFSEWENTR